VLGVAVVAVIIIAIVIVTGGGGGKNASSPPPAHQSTTSAGKTPPSTAPPAPATVSVAVLNGTSTAGAAAHVADTLRAAQFSVGTVADAPDQATSATTVGYTAGHQEAADEVAQKLHLGVSAALPVTPADLTAATAGGSTPDVVVVIGADFAA
jgi:hypothetical protein